MVEDLRLNYAYCIFLVAALRVVLFRMTLMLIDSALLQRKIKREIMDLKRGTDYKKFEVYVKMTDK